MEFFTALWADFKEAAIDPVYIGDSTILSLNIIVWSLFIGFMIAIGATIYNKLVPGAVARALISKKAFTEADAIGAEDAGITNPFVKFALRRGGAFRRIVRVVGDTDEKTAKLPLDTARFYIPEEKVHRAETVYGKKEMSVMSVVLSVAAFFALAIIAIWLIPSLITMLSTFIASITPESNIY